ncbi:pyridoxamine 5'-phosphate oxidase [Aquimarina sp. AD10]|uniref:pyridoxamine 5'-phosphate oxidase family protein n=1 Tax=Aquimarina sp. AD10 TaxID=1714849 RepID=UPI000E4D5649|nr:pyridoxamine 5'-phosphate oxidase family protein [Aquimarina sp. AD10]AXT63382.1 pyridoxamine 5'-phosphate oxidase [Aquimarina sp. AD10]RKN00605.1 pyridoxamine 5'-phosphate oxidase [Aquimarina sp. AD10]
MPDIIFSSIIRDLKAALTTRDHSFRYFTLATTDNYGIPKIRTMVLRGADNNLNITIYTDKRSSKISHIAKQDRVSLLFFDPERLVQVSIQAKAKIEEDDQTLKNIWENIPQKSKKDYTTKFAPGSEIQKPEAVDYLENKHYFSAITFVPESIEYLRLKKPNHMRVLFKKKNSNWNGNYLVP